MNFVPIDYINTLLENFTKNNEYHSYFKLKKNNKQDNLYFIPDTQNIVTDGCEVYGIMKNGKYKCNNIKNVSWNINLFKVHAY